MKKIIYFIALTMLAVSNIAAQAKPTIISKSKSGKSFVYYTNIAQPTTARKPPKYNSDGSMTVDMGNEILEPFTIWIKIFDGQGFKLPSANSKFFRSLKENGKKDGVQIIRYSDTIIKAKCMIKLSECLAKEELAQDEEFILNKLVRVHLGKTLVYTIYEPGESNLRAIWETKTQDNLTVISSDKTVSPNIFIEIETDEKNQTATMVYKIDFMNGKKPATEIVAMSKNKSGAVEITGRRCFELSKDTPAAINQPSQIHSFAEFIPDIDDIAKPFLSPQILKQLEKCGK